jgi:hypothetical protein
LQSTQASFARTPESIMDAATSRVGIPQTGKNWFQPSAFQLLLPVFANVSQEEIAERDTFNASLTASLQVSCMMRS